MLCKDIIIRKNIHFFLYLLLLLFHNSFINFCFCGNYHSDSSFNYPLIRRLNNGNYFAMTSQGIYLYSEDFTLKMEKYKFASALFEDNNENVYSADVAQFLSSDGGYIICLIRNEIFAFSKDIHIVAHLSIDYVQNRVTYKIIPLGQDSSYNNYYNFVIIQVDGYNILVRKYRYDSYRYEIEYVNEYYVSCGYEPYKLSFSCELMNYSSNKVITCFYGAWERLSYVTFDIDSFSKIDDRSSDYSIDGMPGGQYFVTSSSPSDKEKLICCFQRVGNLNCFAYNINNNELSSKVQIESSNCHQEVIQMRIDYFPETEEFLFGCKKNGNLRDYYMGTCNLNLGCTNLGLKENVIPAECTDSNIFHFTYYSGKYSIVSDSTYCQENRLSSFNDINPTKIRDFPSDEPSLEIIPTCDSDEYMSFDNSICYKTIPDGYFYNNTNRTIYKCHTDCAKCDKGPEEGTTNCNKCKDSTKFLYLGNCVSSCESGGTFEDEEDNTIIKCKCSYEKCLYCTKESISKSNILCKTCNTDSGYFPKEIDSTNEDSFINCYKDPEGYYLDWNIYKQCFTTCKKCNGYGDSTNNNCIECIDNHLYLTDFGKNNCYEKCTYNYYYDVNNNNIYTCSGGDNCPDNYKLIPSNKKCINDCQNDELYKYEYNGICYQSCPTETYYNYEHTSCLGAIPDGYYCNSIEDQTLGKCHDYCKTCEEKGTSDNNNCLTCPDTDKIYLDLGNCKESCINGYFVENSIKKCKCSTNIACYYCSKESKEYDLCESCNTEKGYYPKNDDENNVGSFIKCYNNETIFCNYYYYLNNSKYYCTGNDKCPEDFKFLIKDKKICTDDCTKDDEYKYQYNDNCYKMCPKNTTNSKDNKYICQSCKEGLCGDAVVILNEVNDLIEDFPENNSCDNNHVSVEENENFTIYIYQNNNCPENPSQLPLVDFGDCYNTIKKENIIDEDEELIVTKVVIKQNNTSVYSFFDPKTLKKLDSSPCQDQKISVQEEITNKIIDALDDSQEQLILNLLSQGINVFNISDEFYTDLCYQFESPNGKDVPLKVRLEAFFPNITLCEAGCENVGVNLETMKAKCECKFIDLVNMDIMSDNVYGQAIQEIFDIISELNIAVVKCFKDIFNKKYFVKNTGGFIILSLFIGQVVCFIVYSVDGLFYIRKYLLNLVQSYINYTKRNENILNNNDINTPPKRKRKRNNINNSIQSKNRLICNINVNNNISSSKKEMACISSKRIGSKDNKDKFFSNKTNNQTLLSESTPKSTKKNMYKISKKTKEIDLSNNENKNPDLIDMKEYLSLSFDENDFDDVIDKEKRTFCEYFCEKFKLNQIFFNTFCIKEPLRPRSLKILVLIMTIELYFVVNAIFYSEDYLSELFYSTEKEKFYSFIPRRFNEFIYTSAVSGIISYFVGYVFVEETKIKKTFIRNKGGDLKLKYEISVIIKGIKYKFTTIITFSLALTVICFVYISCFNNVYPNIKGEWIKSSLFILFLMQIINFALTLFECILRYISIKCNSEKFFKLSQVFAL